MSKPKRAEDDTVYLGRQPIYGPDREVRAYELLYRRAGGDTVAHVRDGDGASAQVMLQAFLELGLTAVTAEQPAFINHTRRLLMLDPILPADRCVIEVLEDVEPDAETVAAVRRLKSAGYRIALDDFVHRPEMRPLVELADFIKLDYRALGDRGFSEQVGSLKGGKARLLAEKIESEAEFHWCRSLGCELFQGYYLRKPEMLAGRRIPNNRLSVLSLLAGCTDLETSASVIAAIIERDAPLTYGLLRLANSALYRRRSEIRSAAQAVTLLGMDFVFRWATLLSLAGHDDCPTGYLEIALQRARMSELIAPLHTASPQEAYITGLLSTLDFVLNAPLKELLEPLPIDNRYKLAIVAREGTLGAVLDAVTAYEEGRWLPDENSPSMSRAYWDAASYAATMIAEMRVGVGRSQRRAHVTE
ncbi:MAG: HDOD domain-containing protein [Acidobacteria bacterium]|nr:HDOD domain-containing protein [Acidobacteriota bacterium]